MLGCLTLAGFGMACKTPAEGPTNAELWEQFYEGRLETLEIIDEAFDTLGQEYYRLDIEYESIGRSDLARLARRKAKAYHEQHQAIQRRIIDLRGVNARIARGESPIGMVVERVESDVPEAAQNTPAPKPTPAPTPTPRATPRPLPPAPLQAEPPAPLDELRRAPPPKPIPLAPRLQR